MMQMPLPLTRDLVLIGGGHTHALVLRMLGMSRIAGLRLTLINPWPTAAYSGMLPGFVAGHYAIQDLDIDLVRLARFAGARLILGRATGLDRDTRTVTVEGRPPIRFDIASIDIGISSDMPMLPGFAEHAVPAKPLDAFARRWGDFLNDPGQGRVTVIGGGIAGMELALAAAHRLGPKGKVTVVETGRALSATGAAARRAILARAAALGIEVREQAPASAVDRSGVLLADGQQIPSDFIIGAAGTRPQDWLGTTGLHLTQGFVTVAPTLQSVTDPAIFAVGDIAHMRDTPRPKAGVYAVRQAPVLLANLTASLTGKGALQEYRPQSDYLKLVSTGSRTAVADKWGLPLSGPAIWRWKDRIDRRFMRMFATLPQMPQPPLPDRLAAGVGAILADGKPLCGGCGAKVGGADLKTALALLPAPRRADVLTGAGDDAAVLAHGNDRQVFTTDHLREIIPDPYEMTRIAAVHALGDIWAMGASPQAALAQIILPRMSEPMQAATLAEIMAAATSIFGPEGADIVGGHTSIGAELTIGFAVTGLCDRSALTLSGAQPGDALILTKPIGSGTIMAADMQGKAAGADVAAALAHMTLPQGTAAKVLAPIAHAMTDVTGFGLAGHMMGMLDASGVAARIDLDAVAVLPGAESLSAQGHASTLYPQNRAALLGRTDADDRPKARLLFDPQTSGPLLAAIPAGQADEAVAALRRAGYTPSRIGEVIAGTPHIYLGAAASS